MNIISVEDFNKQTTPGNNRYQKIYQEKILIQGPVFALSQKKSALEYSQGYLNKHSQSLCFLVQEKYYFQVWNEEIVVKNIKKSTFLQKQPSVATKDNNIVSIPQNNVPSINTKTALEFTSICQELLSKSIGPISNVICKRALSQNSNLSCKEFIEILAKKIPEEQESKQFRTILLQFTEQNIGLTTPVKDISEHLKKYNKKIDRINSLELEEIVTQMRNTGGVKIKNRRYRLKNYYSCFVGSEAVNWMVNNLNISTEEAIRLGQRLIDEEFIHHVLFRENFQNEYLFYRFYWDEK